MQVYLDNAATTPLQKEVLEAMLPYMKGEYGNPSSIHSFGRKARNAVEQSRKTAAKCLNAEPTDLFFMSGGTEANNFVLFRSVEDLEVENIITSQLEHHCVLHPVEEIDENYSDVSVQYVKVDENGHIDLQHLETLLEEAVGPTLVSLMYANNEIGNLLDVKKVGKICKNHGAFFHSDTVQAVGHYEIDLEEWPVQFITASAHKFHGPKGVGMLYIHPDIDLNPMIHGGSQERDKRAGTENVYGIVGLGKALELRHQNMKEEQHHVRGLKNYMIEQLKDTLPGVEFNGDTSENSLYTVLNVTLPPHESADTMLFNLDMEGIAVSAGSACSSGTNEGSHVLQAIGAVDDRPSLRFSFSKYNTQEEIDFVIETLENIYESETAPQA